MIGFSAGNLLSIAHYGGVNHCLPVCSAEITFRLPNLNSFTFHERGPSNKRKGKWELQVISS